MTMMDASLQTHIPVPTLPLPLNPAREARIAQRWAFWLPQATLRLSRTMGCVTPQDLARLQTLHYSRMRCCYDHRISMINIRRANLDSPLVFESEFIVALAVAIESRVVSDAHRRHRFQIRDRRKDLANVPHFS